MMRWMWIAIALALALAPGCERKPEDPGPSCEAITDHVYEVTRKAYPGHGEMAMGNRKADVARCEARKLTAKQRRCMLAAQTPEGVAQCLPRQKTDEPKGPDAPNNLFGPLEGGPVGPQGSMSKEARSWSAYTWWETHPAAHWAGRALAVAGAGMLTLRLARRS